MNYTITVNERQAGILQKALENYARLGLYQINDSIDSLPKAKTHGVIDYKDEQKIFSILQPYKDAWHKESGGKRSEPHDVAWDLQVVIRHRLAWDGAKQRGEVREDGQRDWGKQLAVWYDTPIQHANEPLAKIEAAE
jgi:hypothetical protein